MDSSVDAPHNIADPLKPILTLALRTGTIQVGSDYDMITKTPKRRD